MRKAIIAASVAAGISFPVLSQTNAPVVGDWYTLGVEHGIKFQMIVHNAADGTFSKDIRDISDCNSTPNSKEAGTWTFVGKRYTEITLTVDGNKVDPTDSKYQDFFDCDSLNSDHFLMHDPKTGLTWDMARVSPSFSFSQTTECTT